MSRRVLQSNENETRAQNCVGFWIEIVFNISIFSLFFVLCITLRDYKLEQILEGD